MNPEYTYTVMPDGMIFDTKQEAKDYIYSAETQMVLEDRMIKQARERELRVKKYMAKTSLHNV